MYGISKVRSLHLLKKKFFKQILKLINNKHSCKIYTKIQF